MNTDFIPAKEIAERLKIDISQVYRRMREGKLPCVRDGKWRRCPRVAYDEWLSRQVAKAQESLKP